MFVIFKLIIFKTDADLSDITWQPLRFMGTVMPTYQTGRQNARGQEWRWNMCSKGQNITNLKKICSYGSSCCVCRFISRHAHLSLLFERFDGEAVSSDVHYRSQLEPVRWVGRPHRLPILHRTALRALENMTERTVREVFSPACNVQCFFVWHKSSDGCSWGVFYSICASENCWNKYKMHDCVTQNSFIFVVLCKQAAPNIQIPTCTFVKP